MDADNLMDLFIENVKKLFFPEDWIKLDLNFSKSEIFTLLFTDKKKEVTMTQLVDYINSPMSTATGIVNRLVKKGYVKRERSQSDRRVVIIKLSQKGREVIKDLKNTVSEYLKMITEDLSEEEKEFLSRIIFKVMKQLQTKMKSPAEDNVKEAKIESIDIE